MIRDNPHKPWQPPSTAPEQPQHMDLQTLISIHSYLHNLITTTTPTRSATMETCLTHIEHQLQTAITGIIVTTQGPTQ